MCPRARPTEAAAFLPMVLTDLMRDTDIPDLVEGTTKQQRFLATCPREVTGDDVAATSARSMTLW